MYPCRLGIDMDDVICDLHGYIYDWCVDNFGFDPAFKYKRHIAGMLTPDQAAQRLALLDEGQVFRDFKPNIGAVEVLEQLVQKHDVFIVTAAMDHPRCLMPKFEWVQEHLPFFNPKKLVFCGDKYVANVDYLIDDSLRHFERLEGEAVVYSAPKNLHETRYKRVNTWAEIADMFL